MHLAWETNSAFVSRSLHGKQGPMASMPPPPKSFSPHLFGFLQLPECHEVFLAWTLLHLLRSGLVSKTCLPVALPATVRCFESLGD
ncbi:mCG147457 [Mus musculus]|nr:mCG147457 [Mus musculus]